MQIKYNDAADTLLAQTKLLWSFNGLKKLPMFALGYIAGIGLCWYGANTDTITSSHTDRHGTSYATIDYHISGALGILVLAFTTYLLVLFFRGRSRSFSEASAVAARWRSRYANEISITVDGSGIRFVSPEKLLEVKWPLVLDYTRYKSHMLLHLSEDWHSAIIIDTRLLSKEEKEELSGLLHRNDVLER